MISSKKITSSIIQHLSFGIKEKQRRPSSPGIPEHIVQFYEADVFLIKSLSTYISAGLQAGEVCIVVATQAHALCLEQALQTQGVDVAAARRDGSYRSLDATDILPQLLVNGELAPERFAELIGHEIVQAQQHQRGLRIFGELVALLWKDGKQAAAICLEALWNEWLRTYGFLLYCAYPLSACAGKGYEQEFLKVCEHHTHVIPTEGYTTLTNQKECLCTVSLLQQKAASLEIEVAARSAAQELEHNKDAFIGMASHELKTPITSLKCMLALLQRYEEAQKDTKALQYIAQMDAQLERISRLISDLLDLSRIQSGKLPYQTERFAFNTLVQDTVKTMQETTRTHRLILEEPEGLGVLEVLGDRDRLSQVVINLLTNAIKYSPQAERVIVRIIKSTEQMHMSVQDFGMGIAREHQQKIFERFYRVHDIETSTYPGLGVGLSICSEIVDWHKGHLWVDSQKGKGSTFYVTLPLIC